MLSITATAQDIFRTRIFEEPLVPIGGEPALAENAALAMALLGYLKRAGPDDFSALTDFLEIHPQSFWNPALLMNLGLEYHNTGRYSKALEVWRLSWGLAKNATEFMGKAVADRAVGELAYLYARLGRMSELDELFTSLDGRDFSGPATERIASAREGLQNMRIRPEIAFRCGPLALYRIKLLLDTQNPGTELIHATASTTQGFSLLQVAALAQRLGLDFQMAFRGKGATVAVPSVVHLQLDHFAAIVRQEGDQYLLQDPTFRHDVWVTREALEDEASGFFLVPAGPLADGWRPVPPPEAEEIWGKGIISGNDPMPHGPCDPTTPGLGSCTKSTDDCKGLAVSRVHLMLASLNINDEPVGYTPPVGPAVRFTVRYNQRENFQPSIFSYANLGPKWTFDWLSYITDKPGSPVDDVSYYIMGGGTRIFTGFAGGSFALQQLDQTLLTRTSRDSYEMLSNDGTLKVFAKSDGATGTKRKVFLSKVVDPSGNAVTLTYDSDMRLTTLTDAIGQVTIIAYGGQNNLQITRVTDPFGRSAVFDYDAVGRLIKITDVMGMSSQFTYGDNDFITALTLPDPYGVTRFSTNQTPVNPLDSSDTFDGRFVETTYPDGTRDRVECNQIKKKVPESDPIQTIPVGIDSFNFFLFARNTYYWSRIACASAYGDYTKAKIYHWLHTPDMASASGILESMKDPLEARVWYDYAHQPGTASIPAIVVGTTNQPFHVGRVLDDGSTQLYTYEYGDLGNLTKTVDPLGRTMSYIYTENGIDLLEIRQTRAGQNELLLKRTYDHRHLPLTSTDTAGQTSTFTYNTRGQMLTVTNAKNETTDYNYDANGFLASVDGPLSVEDRDTSTFIYDSLGRVRTSTDNDGYTLVFDYDALDRVLKITYPDASTAEFTYTLLDLTLARDRAGRETSFTYDSLRQMTSRTDPLGRITRYQWCTCGALKALTDPMGRTTAWRHDLQGRLKCKEYADGSKVTYLYEDSTSRLRQRIDEQLQVTQYSYHADNTLREISYANAVVPTPAVSFAYDPSYSRIASMTDSTGTTLYSYHPITPTPGLGAGQLASIGGPQANDAVTYSYDELGRPVLRGINGVARSVVFDAAGRITSETNAIGTFVYSYDGPSTRQLSTSCPNGQITTFKYFGVLKDHRLELIEHTQGTEAISAFGYDYNVPANRIIKWSQQSGTQNPVVFTFGYDAVNQLTSALAEGDPAKRFAYTYDSVGNRLTEQIGDTTSPASYNALNQLTSTDGNQESAATYEWDAENRLVVVSTGNQRTEFTYDGLGRRVGIRQMLDGVEINSRRFLWCDSEVCEERNSEGIVSKRFFPGGMTIETGSASGAFVYTRDHLESVRELTDSSGHVSARYAYEPFGRQTRVDGSMDSDFGFAGMLWSNEVGFNLTLFRVYDPEVGRWLSRDRLKESEFAVDSNLYTYVRNDPVNAVDQLGLFPTPFRNPKCWCLCQHACGVPPSSFKLQTRERCRYLCGPVAVMTCTPVPFT